ncbi:arginine/serine-rich splicing factor 6-like protein [Leptotrombidium deliense]|uniref:Arginine/serine-rich splicing factor 6-like protein n=1 Tax=Leptotrombidium deliense TaxID=299467 RepID=A0A443RY35_9ACAR|nr:arginine/serine-rich splicing factor 6-like protein [Leptotrombidium deliense]
MEGQLKPLYLAESMEQLEKILESNSTPTLNPTKLADCYLSANFAWLQDDHELAFLLYSQVIQRLDENSILNGEHICDILERIETLTECLKSRYKTIQRKKEITSNDNAIIVTNTVHLNNFSPKYTECIIEGLFSKYGKIEKIWFNVDDELGFGFIEFQQRSSAFDAILEENGNNYDGHDIIVEYFVEKLKRSNSISEKESNCNADCLLNEISGLKIDEPNECKNSTDIDEENVIKTTEWEDDQAKARETIDGDYECPSLKKDSKAEVAQKEMIEYILSSNQASQLSDL